MTYEHQEEVKKGITELENEGFATPKDQGQGEIIMPLSLEGVSDTELAHYLGVWASLYSRARFELAKVEGDELTLEVRKNRIKKVEMAKIGPKEKVTVAKAQIEGREDILSLEEQLIEASVRVKLYKALLDGYGKKFEAVSREITRRHGEKQKWRHSGHIDSSAYVQGEEDRFDV